MINKNILVGRLTKEPELKYTPSGVAVCRFTLAVNRNFSNQQGEKEADFINVVVWRKQAENAANFLKKGHLAGIDGRIESGSYEGQDGKRIYTTEVVAENVQFLEPKRDGQQSQGQQRQQGQQNQNQNQQLSNQSNGQQQQRTQYNQHSKQQQQQQQYAGAGVGGQQNNGNQQHQYSQHSEPFSNNGPGAGYSDDDLPF